MKILSLFDGISCARVALNRTGILIDKYYSSEVDKYAIQIAQKNFPDTIQLGDIKGITKEIVGDIDLMIGGSPCQDLSIAKKNREGLKGQRSGLFYEYVRLLNEVKPKYFILENVNSMPKEAKEQITEILGVEPIMINAALVSAQNRKRLFWTNIPNIEQPEDRGILLKDILQPPAEVDERMIVNGKSFSLTASYNGAVAWNSIAKKQRTMVRVGSLNSGGQGDRIYSPEGKSVNLSANGGGRGAKTGLYATGCASRTYPRYKQKGIKRGKRVEIRDDNKANSMTSVSGDSMVIQNMQIRKLTPIECERLQSLEDNYTEGVSNTQRYKCLGNAFNVEVVAHILNQLIILIEEEGC